MITLTDGAVTVELPFDLDWVDRTQSVVQQRMTRGLTGAPILQEGACQYGMPITLQPPPSSGLMPASSEPQILAWLNTPGLTLTLDFRGEVHAVRWRHYDGEAYTSSPLFYTVEPGQDDLVIPTFRFITVEP